MVVIYIQSGVRAMGGVRKAGHAVLLSNGLRKPGSTQMNRMRTG